MMTQHLFYVGEETDPCSRKNQKQIRFNLLSGANAAYRASLSRMKPIKVTNSINKTNKDLNNINSQKDISLNDDVQIENTDLKNIGKNNIAVVERARSNKTIHTIQNNTFAIEASCLFFGANPTKTVLNDIVDKSRDRNAVGVDKSREIFKEKLVLESPSYPQVSNILPQLCDFERTYDGELVEERHTVTNNLNDLTCRTKKLVLSPEKVFGGEESVISKSILDDVKDKDDDVIIKENDVIDEYDVIDVGKDPQCVLVESESNIVESECDVLKTMTEPFLSIKNDIITEDDDDVITEDYDVINEEHDVMNSGNGSDLEVDCVDEPYTISIFCGCESPGHANYKDDELIVTRNTCDHENHQLSQNSIISTSDGVKWNDSKVSSDIFLENSLNADGEINDHLNDLLEGVCGRKADTSLKRDEYVCLTDDNNNQPFEFPSDDTFESENHRTKIPCENYHERTVGLKNDSHMEIYADQAGSPNKERVVESDIVASKCDVLEAMSEPFLYDIRKDQDKSHICLWQVSDDEKCIYDDQVDIESEESDNDGDGEIDNYNNNSNNNNNNNNSNNNNNNNNIDMSLCYGKQSYEDNDGNEIETTDTKLGENVQNLTHHFGDVVSTNETVDDINTNYHNIHDKSARRQSVDIEFEIVGAHDDTRSNQEPSFEYVGEGIATTDNLCTNSCNKNENAVIITKNGHNENKNLELIEDCTNENENLQISTKDYTIESENPEIITKDCTNLSENPEFITKDYTIESENPEIITKDCTNLSENPELITEDYTIESENTEIITKDCTNLSENPEFITEDYTIESENPEIITKDCTNLSENPVFITKDCTNQGDTQQVITKNYSNKSECTKIVTKNCTNQSERSELMIKDYIEQNENPVIIDNYDDREVIERCSENRYDENITMNSQCNKREEPIEGFDQSIETTENHVEKIEDRSKIQGSIYNGHLKTDSEYTVICNKLDIFYENLKSFIEPSSNEDKSYHPQSSIVNDDEVFPPGKSDGPILDTSIDISNHNNIGELDNYKIDIKPLLKCCDYKGTENEVENEEHDFEFDVELHIKKQNDSRHKKEKRIQTLFYIILEYLVDSEEESSFNDLLGPSRQHHTSDMGPCKTDRKPLLAKESTFVESNETENVITEEETVCLYSEPDLTHLTMNNSFDETDDFFNYTRSTNSFTNSKSFNMEDFITNNRQSSPKKNKESRESFTDMNELDRYSTGLIGHVSALINDSNVLIRETMAPPLPSNDGNTRTSIEDVAALLNDSTSLIGDSAGLLEEATALMDGSTILIKGSTASVGKALESISEYTTVSHERSLIQDGDPDSDTNPLINDIEVLINNTSTTINEFSTVVETSTVPHQLQPSNDNDSISGSILFDDSGILIGSSAVNNGKSDSQSRTSYEMKNDEERPVGLGFKHLAGNSTKNSNHDLSSDSSDDECYQTVLDRFNALISNRL